MPLCDLLPQAIPSLVVNLQTAQFGRITLEKRVEISKRLGCPDLPFTFEEVVISIFSQPVKCNFPGHEIYEAILPINNIVKSAQESLEMAKKYVTPLNLEYNYLHKSRTREVVSRLNGDYYSMINFKNTFTIAAQSIYSNDTISEWLAVYLIPSLDPIYEILTKIELKIETNDWRPRPLPVTLKTYPERIFKKFNSHRNIYKVVG